MSSTHFSIEQDNEACTLHISSHWQLGSAPDGDAICAALNSAFSLSATSLPTPLTRSFSSSTRAKSILLNTQNLGSWDSSLVIALLQVTQWSDSNKIELDIHSAPEGLQQLLKLATAIPAYTSAPAQPKNHFFIRVAQAFDSLWQGLSTSLIFIGDLSLAFVQWLRGKAKTRSGDIAFFIDQAGPKALAIVTLIALLVGMILAYLGSVQLRQLGAQVYVADLVAIGMVREMGALMTAVIMAGRTGAAYAAQLGTMQVNEEIDALKTMGISSVEFLVLPRLLALVFVMPLLCIYANVVGMMGGAIVATSMDVNITQYVLQSQGAVDWVDITTGLVKSIFFGVLIAIAGCQAGLHCGRNSDAVGMAATNAVVRAIVYLVVADAAFNILYDKLGI